MQKHFISKDKIIVQLMELEKELEQLELSLHASLNELKGDWLKDQEEKLNDCNNRMKAVEQAYQDNRKQNGQDYCLPFKVNCEPIV